MANEVKKSGRRLRECLAEHDAAVADSVRNMVNAMDGRAANLRLELVDTARLRLRDAVAGGPVESV